ncbi:CPSF A subunit region-domain-containing protein [Lipomyces japonicus]|uniref:CPSF A subunit region-domain-containing protein n=1 Tax=Lipomyces japonicus TaxID=56871 RepID=UPI0034CEBF19
MQVYRDLTPPTVVTHCLSASFTSPGRPNLIVVKGSSLLQIFQFVSHESDAAAVENGDGQYNDVDNGQVTTQDGDAENFIADLDIQRSATSHQTKLDLVTEYELHGTVIGINRVRISNSNDDSIESGRTDYLLIAFESAKLSLLFWDRNTHVISTVSLHYYEKEHILPVINTDQASSFLRTDPDSNCSCLKFGRDTFAFLPFVRDNDDEIFAASLSSSLSVATTNKTDGIAANSLSYPSFVISAKKLDNNISTVIDASFLFEYREPTLAVLHEPKRTWTGLLHDTRDTISLVVVALDLHQRASTAILSISNLPYDLVTIVALPNPIGGVLLLGANELIHVHAAGRVKGIAVNPAAFDASNFEFIDRSFLEIRLEGAKAVHLQDNFVLLILSTGDVHLLEFVMDGRSVEGLELHVLDLTDKLMGSAASCLEVFPDKKRIFIGSREADAVLLAWRKIGEKSSTKQQQNGKVDQAIETTTIETKEYEDEDEDLYSVPASGAAYKLAATSAQLYGEEEADEDAYRRYVFAVHDRLINLGPIINMSIGTLSSSGASSASLLSSSRQDAGSKLEIVGARGGNSQSGGLSVFRRTINPLVLGRIPFNECRALWAVHAKSADTKTTSTLETGIDPFDRYLIVGQREESVIFKIGRKLEQVRSSTEFDTRSPTIAVRSILDGTRIVQVCPAEIRVYDSDLQLLQMVPLDEEEEEKEGTEVNGIASVEVVAASFTDDSVLVVLENGRATLFVTNKQNMDLEPSQLLSGKIFTSGTLAYFNKSYFPESAHGKKRKRDDNDLTDNSSTTSSAPESSIGEPVCIMVTKEGELQLYRLSDSTMAFQVAHANNLPTILQVNHDKQADGLPRRPTVNGLRRKSSAGFIPRAANTGRHDNIVEILFTELGDEVVKKPYLLLRTDENAVVVYEPFLDGSAQLNFRKIATSIATRTTACKSQQRQQESQSEPENAAAPSTSNKSQRLVPLKNVSGLSAVFVCDADQQIDEGDVKLYSEAFWIIKTAKSLPQFIPFSNNKIRSLSSFNTELADRAFVYVDIMGTIRICGLPKDFNYDTRWPAKKITMEEDVHAVTFYQEKSVYVVSASNQILFSNKDEERETELAETTFGAVTDHGVLKLFSPKSWIVVDTFDEFEPNEVALVVKAVNLQVSEHSNARRQFLAVGTGINNGEDLAAKGFVYIFEIIEVVPEPGKPEHNHKFKLIVKEDVRGVVSTLCDINGYLLSAQGQKVMVRALREDNSFLPVAFMDMNMYVTESKSLRNYLLLGDIMKSVWFVGFTEDPYKMQLFGKDLRKLEVVAADFVINGTHMHFVIVDGERKIHILQYDPENPRSLSGQRLILKSEFYVGRSIQSLLMVPKFEEYQRSTESITDAANGSAGAGDNNSSEVQYLTLGCTADGNLVAVVPISEIKYRQLLSVQQQITDKVAHVAGLNPKVHRTTFTSSDFGSAARAVLDGNLLLQFASLSINRQFDITDRVGKNADTEVWNSLVELDRSLNYM